MADAGSSYVPQTSSTGFTRMKRVARACERCKRQKLKCDSYRPCSLCVRAGKTCTPSQPLRRRPRGSKPEKRVQANGTKSPQIPATIPSPNSPANPPLQPQSQPQPSTLLPTSPSTKAMKPLTRTSQFVKLLPNKNATRFLNSVYFERINWYTFLFHQGTFTFEVEKILAVLGRGQELEDTGQNFSLMALLLMVLALGGLYVRKDQQLLQNFESLGGGELGCFAAAVIDKVGGFYLDLVELENIEGVRACVLLGQFHLHYTHRYKLAAECFAAGVRIAGIIGLERNSLGQSWWEEVRGEVGWDVWRPPKLIMDQIRKRVFWILFESERTMALYFGRPVALIHWERDVNEAEELNNFKPRRWHSVEKWVEGDENDNCTGVTLLEFRRRSAELWWLVGDILVNIYGVNRHGNSIPKEELGKMVEHYKEKLINWHSALHPCLCFREHSYPPSSSPLPHSPEFEKTIFQMQSLALHLSFNETLLLLHRPLLPYPSTHPAVTQTCLSAAFEISEIIKAHPLLLSKALGTHLAVKLGPQFQTAGIVLCIILAMKPMHPEAQEIKFAIGRILESLRSIQDYKRVSVLEKLVERTLKMELERMIHGLREQEGEGETRGFAEVLAEVLAELKDVCENTKPDGNEFGVTCWDRYCPENSKLEQMWLWFGSN